VPEQRLKMEPAPVRKAGAGSAFHLPAGTI